MLLPFVIFGLLIWAIIVTATRRSLSPVSWILLIGIAVVAPVVGTLGVLIATPFFCPGVSPFETADPSLVLREFIENDGPAVYRINLDPEAKRFLPSDTLSEDEAKERMQWYIEQAREVPHVFHDLAIVLSNTLEVVGWYRLAHRFDEVRQGEIPYRLTQDLWGRGSQPR